MKKEKLFCLFLSFSLLFSCQVGFEGEVGNKKVAQRSVNYKKDAPDHIDLPLLSGGMKRVDVTKGYYIVRTHKDFDKSKFLKLGARVCGTMKADSDNIFWHLYKNDEFFLKKVLKVEGVISAEYDFTIYHVNPPKDPLKDLKPKPNDGHNGDVGIIRPRGLENGNMDNDPRMKEVNYSLQITHALEAYKEYKDKHFKKPVLLGLIDTGFNYCNEDFWFTNSKGKEESVSYFTKSAFLVDLGSREFVYNLSDPVDENDPMVPYAKEFIKNYRNSNRFFEMPCSKVDPDGGQSGYNGPNSVMFWNWDDGEHGTHCSGMMAAVGDNGKGVVGVSWKNTKIASYKCFGGPRSNGWEIYGALDDYASYIEAGLAGTLDNKTYYKYSFETLDKRDGIHTADAEHSYTTEQEKFNPYKDQGIYPVNMSLGGPFPTQFAAIVMSRCLKTGILPVVAMGNDGQRLVEFPASYDAVLAVGATDGRDRKKGFSCSGEWIDICAPGDGILSTGISPGHNYPWAVHWLPEGQGRKPWSQQEIGTAYTTMSGTSMATPFTTGVLGYLLSFEKARGKDPGWIKAIIQSTADPLEGQAKGVHHEDYGYGRVNVLEAARAVEEGKTFANTEFDYNTKNYVTVKLRNKRSKTPDANGDIPTDVELGLSGHSVVVYADGSGDPKGFSMTNNKGEAEFFFLPKGKKYVARVDIDGEYYEANFEIKDEKQDVTIEYDSPIIYISTITPHKSIFEKYSPDGEYAREVDTIISIYEDGKFDQPIERMDYYTLDTMAFNAKSGKTYFAEITCFADPSTGNYRAGIYGLRIGYESLNSFRNGNSDFLKPEDYEHDAKINQPKTGRPIYELIHGMDCWEPNDDFAAARDKGDFIDFSKKTDLKGYIVCCLTHQSDGLDRDIFMFKTPDWDEE